MKLTHDLKKDAKALAKRIKDTSIPIALKAGPFDDLPELVNGLTKGHFVVALEGTPLAFKRALNISTEVLYTSVFAEDLVLPEQTKFLLAPFNTVLSKSDIDIVQLNKMYKTLGKRGIVVIKVIVNEAPNKGDENGTNR